MDAGISVGTIPIQVGIFGLSYLILKKMVFSPYLKLIELRKSKMEGLFQRAQAEEAQAEAHQAEYETFVQTARIEINTWVDKEKKRIAEHHKSVIEKARSEVAENVAKTREVVSGQMKAVKSQLEPMVPEFAGQISKKLLSSSGGTAHPTSTSPGSSQVEGRVN